MRELLREVIARALHLREQRVERIELCRIPRLQLAEVCIQVRTLIGDVLDRRVQGFAALVEQAVAADVVVEQGAELNRDSDFVPGEQLTYAVEIRVERVIELRAIDRELAVEPGADTDLGEHVRRVRRARHRRRQDAAQLILDVQYAGVAEQRAALLRAGVVARDAFY